MFNNLFNFEEQTKKMSVVIQVILGTVFYRSNDPTNSVKALKEDRS